LRASSTYSVSARPAESCRSESTWSTCRSAFGPYRQFIKREQIAAHQHEESTSALQGARALLDASGVRTPCIPSRMDAEVIVRLADSLHCDHIVMGTHGRSALTELLIGSTT